MFVLPAMPMLPAVLVLPAVPVLPDVPVLPPLLVVPPLPLPALVLPPLPVDPLTDVEPAGRLVEPLIEVLPPMLVGAPALGVMEVPATLKLPASLPGTSGTLPSTQAIAVTVASKEKVQKARSFIGGSL